MLLAIQVIASNELRFLENEDPATVEPDLSDTATSNEEENENPTDDNVGIDFMKWYKIIILTVGAAAVFLVFYTIGYLIFICCG